MSSSLTIRPMAFRRSPYPEGQHEYKAPPRLSLQLKPMTRIKMASIFELAKTIHLFVQADYKTVMLPVVCTSVCVQIQTI